MVGLAPLVAVLLLAHCIVQAATSKAQQAKLNLLLKVNYKNTSQSKMAAHVRHACTGLVAAVSVCQKVDQNMPATAHCFYFRTNYAKPSILEFN